MYVIACINEDGVIACINEDGVIACINEDGVIACKRLLLCIASTSELWALFHDLMRRQSPKENLETKSVELKLGYSCPMLIAWL
jgi:hypothetical protein